MTERLISPSSITAWLDCAHFLTLKHQVQDGLREAPGGGMGSFAQLLLDKGLEHELACLADYERQGKRILHVPERNHGESFATWVARVGDPFDDGYDVIYQMPFIHDSIRGIADFLVRVDDESGATFEPVDAKLARNEAKPGHVLQLCFYADAIEATTGRRPKRMHLWLGSGSQETLTVADFGAYWRRLRAQLGAVLDAPTGVLATVAERCDHCAFCEFVEVCDQEWRTADSLIYVAGIRPNDRAVLENGGVTTLAELAVRTDPVDGLRPERQERLVAQADLQAQARADADAKPPFTVIPVGEDLTWGHGFDQLPAPDPGDVFLDFEGHPFWRADRGLFFLLGLIEQDDSGAWVYRTWWAHTPDEEGAAALALIDHLTERRAQFPGMHVYHYNHTERSSLQRLAEEHGLGELALARLVDTGAFVDLLVVARNAVQVGTESYSLKAVERLTDYERGHEIDKGAGAVVEYEQYMSDGSVDALDRIAAYNEDDVRATRALRDWLVDHRPSDLPWRAAELQPSDDLPDLDEQVERLHAYGPGTTEHLLGDVLGYWRREWQAYLAPLLTRCEGETAELRDDPEVLAGLIATGLVPRYGRTGKVLAGQAMRFITSRQECALAKGAQVVYARADGGVGFSAVDDIDLEEGYVDLKWPDEGPQPPACPSVVVHYDSVPPNPKPAALSEFASLVLDPSLGEPNPVTLALLCRHVPKFASGAGPAGGVFSDDLDEMLAWAAHLDHSYVAIQGPPGTGKTYRGARLIHALITAGKRVGITAMSHHAIENLLDAAVDEFERVGDQGLLHAVKKGHQPSNGGRTSVAYTNDNKRAARPEFNLVAGTTWLFANDQMLVNPVDVLLIDEAGQLALADALAATRSAHNLVLLGDPLQLAQVSKAAHPSGGGDSVLEHVLGDQATMPAERGVFLSETRRMHPDVCSFISDEIYEGRLTSHASCHRQTTEFGTGLRWLRAEHVGRSTESEEEADLIRREVTRLLGTTWTDQEGVSRTLEVEDVLVVAPYNDQVRLLREHMDADSATRGVMVGTVDKFQGRQATVVFFSMATSTMADSTRGGDFLFSRNRFNVAISRARCLAYLVCTEDLLNSRGRDIEEMRLISTICSFVERTP